MDRYSFWMGAGLLLAATVHAAAETGPVSRVDRLLAQGKAIRTVRCEIRREVESEGGSVPTLSRVWFARPDRLRVEMEVPEARRIVGDGAAIYKWINGQTRGVRIPLGEAPPFELVQLRRVPGSADDQLMRLRAFPEKALPPGDGFPERFAVEPPAPRPYTVLSLDATGRLARLEFFDSPAATNRLLCVDYIGWKEAGPGYWIPCLQKTQARGRDGANVHETLRVSNLAVNEPIPPDNFDVLHQAPGVTFLSPAEAEEAMKRDMKKAEKQKK